MKWFVILLFPLQVFSQGNYNNCEPIPVQNYEVLYDINKDYYWEVDGGVITTVNAHQVSVQWNATPGTHILSVYTGIGGCVGDTSYYTVKVEECSPFLYIPNSFTPDGDGVNEVFQVEGSPGIEFHLIIFNRWGEVIFESYNISDYWDGTYKKLQCQEGVYIYSVRHVTPPHKVNLFVGHVTLLR
tara:strand:+ start:634 stop:1188 length:555 start_codon:yes stop_codon:yes gene_type:complete